MHRACWYGCGTALLGLAGIAFVAIRAVNNLLPKPEPFSNTYSIQGGGTVNVSGSRDSGFDGDTVTNYQISLRLPGGQAEHVSSGQAFYQDAPAGPFRLGKSTSELFLASDREIYHRPITGATWHTWNVGKDESVPYFERAILPGTRGPKETFGTNWPSQSSHDGLPDVSSYAVQHWDAADNTVVMRRQDTAAGARDLVFTNWKLDVGKTLAHSPGLKLRPLPHDIRVEVLTMYFPRNFSWQEKLLFENGRGDRFYRYEDATNLPEGRVIAREKFILSAKSHRTPLSSWWNQRGPVTLQLRGICGDSNPNLVHFQWQIGDKPSQWAIAHNGEWRPIRESGYALEPPYVLTRFSWAAPKSNRTAKPQSQGSNSRP